jgi:hypothetical protein
VPLSLSTPCEDEHGEYVIRGVIIDHPTPFTLKEMTDANAVEGVHWATIYSFVEVGREEMGYSVS